MSITHQQITHLAHLARLNLAPDEINAYVGHMSSIMELVAQMQNINTQDITPMAHPQAAALRLRDDQVTASNQRAQYQQIAPASAHGLYLVPQVIE